MTRSVTAGDRRGPQLVEIAEGPRWWRISGPPDDGEYQGLQRAGKEIVNAKSQLSSLTFKTLLPWTVGELYNCREMSFNFYKGHLGLRLYYKIIQ
ncbi:hypothetical protein Btru_070988 [Bulinus truncatus]|nr:hypothetical protein Btru_070988 [Bulinus truncatus]